MNVLSALLLVVLLLVIFSTLFVSCNNAAPFNTETVFQKSSKFEPFGGKHDTDYSSKEDNSAMDMYKPFVMDGQSTDCKKVYGFTGLFCQPDNINNPVDKFASAKGSLECKHGSSGLSNSKGPLCLTEEHKKLLSSRGGNMSREANIGN